MKNFNSMIMVGPDLNSFGGISRVAKIWQGSSLFQDNHIKYIPSVTDYPSKKVFYLLRALYLFTLANMRSCRLVYVHTAGYRSFYRKSLFILIAICFRRNTFLHIHTNDFFSFLATINSTKKIFVFFLLKRIGVFVVLTEGMKQNLVKILPNNCVVVLSNSINFKRMEIGTKVYRKENSLVFLGWYIKEKGVYELVDAIELLIRQGFDVHLDFYGTKEIKVLTDYVKNKKLEKVISVNGWISGKNKLKVLYKSGALILPSHSEGFPNVVLEAMATHTPIIATSVGGLKEILIDGENAIIANVGDSKDLSKKILRCIKNRALREKIAENAYQDAKLKFDITVIKKKFSQIISTFSE